MSVKILHAADLHLDSVFRNLLPEQAKLRREEGRALPERIANYVNQNGVQVVLLAGDLFDGNETYRDTYERLIAALGSMQARVFIAPGNHDPYSERSPYAALEWPENVHIFRSPCIERVEIPELSCAVYGAAFTSTSQEESLLEGFCAEEDGLVHLMVLHGDLNAGEARYDPITKQQIAKSNLDYLALGHIHLRSDVLQEGATHYAYCGCPEGHGFDELGEKGVLCGEVSKDGVKLEFVPLATRRYQILRVDVTGQAPENAIRSALPKHTTRDLYRVILSGETDERGVDLNALMQTFAPDFYRLDLRDETRIAQDIWARIEEDSLRGIFLRRLREEYEATADEAQRRQIELAVRYGLAALDHREL